MSLSVMEKSWSSRPFKMILVSLVVLLGMPHLSTCDRVDGGWGDWTSWTVECTKTCGNGTRTRGRHCNNPIPSEDGQACNGSADQVRFCNEQPCPVDGGWGDWTSWTVECTKTCGNGTRTRGRHCNNPIPSEDGQACNGSADQVMFCNEQPCPVDGGWGDWTSWTVECTKTCGNGTRTRGRHCNNPIPSEDGQACNGSADQVMFCNEQPCPEAGNWGSWLEWLDCSTSCSAGTQNRVRKCDNPQPRHGGADCIGSDIDTQDCNYGPCPVDGGWGHWNCWTGECSKTCGTGTRTRGRYCDNPTPSENGQRCNGPEEDIDYCNEQPCPEAGNWGQWHEWFDCSKSCGAGTQERVRLCNKPRPKNGGAYCQGVNTNMQSCNKGHCPVHGRWGDWSAYSDCSTTCGPGVRTSIRQCQEPRHGGRDCIGNESKTLPCNRRRCPVNGQWSVWTSWSGCSVTCAQGSRTRTRSCTNPKPERGGQDCQGQDQNSSSCVADRLHCPVDGGWSDWVTTRRCSDCTGVQVRSRRCTDPRPQHGGAICPGGMHETVPCQNTPMCRHG